MGNPMQQVYKFLVAVSLVVVAAACSTMGSPGDGFRGVWHAARQ